MTEEGDSIPVSNLIEKGWLDEDGARTVSIRPREPAICGYHVTLHNFYGNVYFHLVPEEFLRLMQWGEAHRQELEELTRDD